jgi:hypothetical protein
MRKKKFITGSAATYCLLPRQEIQPEPSSGGHTWLRTDLNVDFKPFAAEDGDDLSHESLLAGVLLKPEGLCRMGTTVNLTEEVNEEHFLRTIGTDPTAVFVSATGSTGNSLSINLPTSNVRTDTENAPLGSSETEEVSSEVQAIASSFQEIESTPSDDDYTDEYDDFFHQIIQGPKLKVPESRTKSVQLVRSNLLKINEGIVATSEDKMFDKLVQSYADVNTKDETSVVPRENYDDLDVLTTVLKTTENDEVAERLAAIRVTGKQVCKGSININPTAEVPGSCQNLSHLSDSYVPNVRSKWDCESVVSTYSCIEHHPRLLSPSGFRPSAKTQPLKCSLSGSGQIKSISPDNAGLKSYHTSNREDNENCTHSVDLPAISPATQEYDCIWRHNISRKGETKEEKKERKAAVKAGRKQARSSKKHIKGAFKKEEVALRQISDHIPLKCSVVNLT